MSNVKKPGAVDRARTRVRSFAFEALYSHFAWAYDWVSRTFFMGQWRIWQQAALRFVEGQRVLELGMGTGNLQLDLVRAGYAAWGVDLSPQMLRQATRKMKASAVPLLSCRARSQALPFPDGAFDTVVSTFPSDYIIDPRTLSEIRRVLVPGGRLIIIPGGWLHPRGTQSRVLERVADVVYGDKSGGTGAQTWGTEQKIERTGWIGVLLKRLKSYGFSTSTHIVSNTRSAAVAIVAVRDSGDM
jgi:SAM-dependent methyltransferase